MSSVFFYEPFYDFDRLFDDSLFSQAAHSRGGNQQLQRRNENDGAIRAFRPRMDLHEDAEKNIVTASFEFPGISKEDVQIDVHNGRLIVSAEAKQSVQHDERGYAVRERRFGKYSRTLQLPQGVKDDEIKASMEHGILNITFPKSTPELAPKKITVN
ncbi:HSP20-like chaperone [Crepidotus variabilis]|uniref:HSP20-like chaperone n=1 Tax=Crepidotus variabilis TaxID=179855 RepID=A0A9P6JT21_9AGAR|nr:HSP20-like chaperone [Crepidotus variabilis]